MKLQAVRADRTFVFKGNIQFKISFQAASTLVAQFEKAGILKEITGRKRDKRYIYADYLGILSEGTK